MAATAAPRTALQTVNNLSDASRIAWRWAITFTRRESPPPAGATANSPPEPRRHPRRSLIGTFAVPTMWLANLGMISIHPHQIVHSGPAAMRVPNPRRQASRSLLPEGLLVVLAAIVALSVTLSLPAYPQPAVRAVGYLAWAALLAVLIATAANAGQQYRQGRKAGSLTSRRKQLTHRYRGSTVVVGSMFGAWPRGGGAGGRLFSDILSELARDHVTMIVTARDAGIADWYVTKHHGHQHDPAGHPLHIEWLNP